MDSEFDQLAGADIKNPGKAARRRLTEEQQALTYSRTSLQFHDPDVERAYLAYRHPRVLQTLRWILIIGCSLVFVGSAIDFHRLGPVQAQELTIIRVIVLAGMLGALWLTYAERVQARLFDFIAAGCAATHLVWLSVVPIIDDRIADYTGVLPINLMLTFLASGLMFRRARWIALAAACAYSAALFWKHEAPHPPVLYMLIAGVYAAFAAYVAEQARRDAWIESKALEAEKQLSDKLLLNVLPPSIAGRMKRGEDLIADRFDDAAVLFADLVGFTSMSSHMRPEDLVEVLDDIFRTWDEISDDLDLEKIKTIGDCYMSACGLPPERANEHWRIAEAALRMQDALVRVRSEHGVDLTARIGMHCGPVVAGVIGRSKFVYDLWGDTVNTASRMESNAPKGAIQMSEVMMTHLKDRYEVEKRGEIEMKGKGMQMTYLLKGRLA